MLNQLAWKASWRHLFLHPWQLGLLILGIALGVAVVVAVDLATNSATLAFNDAAKTFSSTTTHQIIDPDKKLDEHVYLKLKRKHPQLSLAPIVQGYLSSPEYPGRRFHIIGIDPFSETSFRSEGSLLDSETLTQLLTQPLTALATKDLRSEAPTLPLITKNTTGDITENTIQQLKIVGVMTENPDASALLESVLMVDIATAQELFNMEGYLSQIDLILPEHDTTAIVQKIQKDLPAGYQLNSIESKTNALTQMTKAFRVNLLAMSLLAIVVGMFIISNAISFSVLQRRKIFGTLRSVGAEPKLILKIIMVEALVIGCVGTFLGFVLGAFLAEALLALVTQTINDLYFQLETSSLVIDSTSIMKGAGLGVGATLIAALIPALEAVKSSSDSVVRRSSIESTSAMLIPKLALTGVGIIVLGAALILLPIDSLVLGFTALFFILMGYALLSPWAILKLSTHLQFIMARLFGITGSMACRSINRNISRTGIATAALLIAIATTVGVTTMIGSFRVAVENWIENSLSADLYISVADKSRSSNIINPKFITELQQHLPGITISQGRSQQIHTATQPINLLALDLPRRGFEGFLFKHGDMDKAWVAFNKDNSVLLSEPFAYHHKLELGDVLTLPTPLSATGETQLRVAGIFYNYASERGIAIINLNLYRQLWDDTTLSSVGVYLDDRRTYDENIDTINNLLKDYPELQLLKSSEIRSMTLGVFDRTFAVTDVLRLLTLIVAIVGILGALMALQLERMREIATLKAIGFTPRQIQYLLITETGLNGLLAGLLSLPLGIMMAVILIHEINQISFGWSMPLSLDPLQFVYAVLIALAAAIIAGLYPAKLLSKAPAAEALRYE
ncbi:AttF component of AttEFGH ABC transport system / AttG component of AttEFGH ABC transport system [hydrothermal vent metagenome]|uniref:AttF component of AttEFGH ABC transport system / AttG component of AttEFGH ABC transport system n=1 Tax=hydrothermal vent metagenome TaxID=652676 RepID=A0A3B0Z5H0_9ZZZZ